MIIPGANRRTVRLKLPHSSLYIVPSFIILVLAGFFLTIYVLDYHFNQTTTTLKQNFDGQERRLSNQIVMQEAELERLQGNLIDLSAQAGEFKAKLEEIKRIKTVLDMMTHSGGTSRDSGKLTLQSSPPAGNEPEDLGGADIPVASDEVAKLVSDTKSGLSGLVTDINDLLADLTESEAKLKELERLRNITPTLWPTASRRITSGFGIRRDPFTQKPSMHTGIDLDGEMNDPVYAAAEGKVVLAEFDSMHGNRILIDHSRGLKTQYLHLNKMLVIPGEHVTKGQKIGLMGTTGRSTGTHLHYEVNKNNKQVDPTPYLLTIRKEE